MPANDREVFEDLTSGDGGASAVNFLTYALFAFERREWIQHHAAAHGGTAPTQAEIDTWISNLTPYQFEQMRSRAAGTFDVAARNYMADEIDTARQETLQGAVVREVRAAGSFWRQLFIALATAILAPVIIGVIVVAALRSEDVIPTITGSKNTMAPKSETPNTPPQK